MPAGCLRRRESFDDGPEPVGHLIDRVLQPGREVHDQVAGATVGPRDRPWSRLPQPGMDALEPVTMRLQRVCCFVQQSPQARLVVCVRVHASRSRTVRSACMALAVWLFTAPRLICMASAIWASDISA